MTDEFTKTSFCVFMNHEKKKCNLVKEKKTLGLKLIKKKKNLAHLFSVPSRPIQFIVCGFCVLEEQSCFLLIEKEE